jgi:hypothetical protein
MPYVEDEIMALLKERVLEALHAMTQELGVPPSTRALSRRVSANPSTVERCLVALSDTGDVVRIHQCQGDRECLITMTAQEFVARMTREGSLLWQAWHDGEIPGSSYEDAIAHAADLDWRTPNETVFLYRKALAALARIPRQPHSPADAAKLVCLGCGTAVMPTSPEDVGAHAARHGRCERCAGQEE